MTKRLVTDGPTALYHYFDGKDRLLYIGISGNHWLRTLTHVSKSGWMELAAGSTIARYPSRREALKAERAAIWDERPLFNWQYNDTAAALARLRAYLTEIGRMDLFTHRAPGTGGTGELGQSKYRVQQGTPAPCPDHVEAEFDYRVEVGHGLDCFGQPVTERGIVIVHVYDGKECAEIYLNADEARELAGALNDHAGESVALKAEGEMRMEPSSITQWARRKAARRSSGRRWSSLRDLPAVGERLPPRSA